ncbi:MAG: fibronectin type III domain-containing protein, partial [Flavobacterium sp.]|nr:fibronectin type III domain-containing protein [Candidatus Neoflavobacterium equi]
QNVNEDTTLWTSAAAQTGITGRVMSLSASSTLASDDWFYLQGLQMTAGQSYRLSFKFKKGTASANQKLKIAYGLSTTNNAMTNQIVDVVFPTSADAQSFYVDFIPAITGAYYIGFHGYAAASQGTLYVGEIKVENAPSCMEPLNVSLSNVTKNSVQLNWVAPLIIPTNGYFYEVRTSGNAGSGEVGLFQSGTASASDIQKIITGLLPSNTYTIFIRSVCGTDNNSIWVSVGTITTFCDYPDFVSASAATICGTGSANLSANFGAGSVYWFDAASGGNLLSSDSNFTTPNISTTTSFYATGGNIASNVTVFAGTGTETSITYSNPFYSLWSNNHTQHLITAEELLSYGLAAGPITSIGLDVTSAGTLPMLGLSIKIGNSSATAMTAFDTAAVMNSVYTNDSYMPTTGVNNFVFTTPFVWDGVSNIIVEFCHGNPSSSATMNRTVKTVTTSFVSTVKSHKSSSTNANVICGDTTSNLLSYSIRPQFIFQGNGLCLNPTRTEVIATVTAAPILTLSETEVTFCEGNSVTITLVSGSNEYDTFNWVPSIGVSGDATDGWFFNPNVSTEYVLTASQSSGNECSAVV